MIPWYIYAGTTALLVLGFLVNRTAVFFICAMMTGGMISPVAMELDPPIWLEMIVLFPALCLILAFIAGPPPSCKETPPSEENGQPPL